MKSVSWLIIDELDSGQGQFDEYYNRLDSIVPTPDTEILELDTEKREPWDTQEIKEVMLERDWGQAFVRTMQKAAPRDIHRGSIIHRPTRSEIDDTLGSLLTQVNTSEWEHGGKIAVRELIDLRFCMGDKHTMCHPEVRYFIEGGEVLFKTPDTATFSCPASYSHLESLVENATTPDEMAEKVASEFDEKSWAVDFAMDTKGDWYCLEMNLNGVRWDSDSERWRNMCGYGGLESHSPEVIHGYVLRRNPVE